MKKIVAHIVLGFGFALLSGNINAAPSVPAAPAAINDECSQEILLSYYPGIFVSETLNKFNVPKDQWDAIKKELLSRDKEIIKLVEAKASKMTPNPLKDPEQRQAAVKLFRETLLENFSAVLKSHGINDDKQILSMLDDIQQQKAKRFAKCMETRRTAQTPVPPAAKQADDKKSSLSTEKKEKESSKTDEEDYDDDEDDEDDDYDDEDEKIEKKS